MSRDKLTANREYYVRDDGSNSNNGRTNSAAGAWLTPQFAANFIASNLDFAGFRIIVNIVPSSGSKSFPGVFNRNYVGGGQLYWKGDINTPSNTILLNAVNPFFGFNQGSFNVLQRTDTEIWVNGFRFAPTAGPCIDPDPSSCGDQQVIFGDLENFTTANIEFAGNGNFGSIIAGNFFDGGNTMIIDGSELTNCGAFLNTLTNSAPFLGSTITIQDTPAITSFFVVNERSALSNFATFAGTSTTGKKFQVQEGGELFSPDLSGIPGSLDGTVDSTGFALYTGSDSVFGGTVKRDDYITNITAATTNLTNLNSGRTYTNTGATARVDFNLPSGQADLVFKFMVRDTDGIRVIAAGGDTIEVGGVASAAGGRIDANVIGDTIEIKCINGTEWVAMTTIGTWTPT